MIAITDLAILPYEYQDVTACETDGVLVSFGDWEKGDDESLLPFTQADIDGWETHEKTAAEIAEEELGEMSQSARAQIGAIALAMIALWTDDIQLPLPANWTAAVGELKTKAASLPDDEVARFGLLTQEAMAYNDQLFRAGGTWEQVLYLAEQ